MSKNHKAIHLNLNGEQLEDYDFARQETGITNDNDLLRHLLRQFRLEKQRPARTLVDTGVEYRTDRPTQYITAQIPEE